MKNLLVLATLMVLVAQAQGAEHLTINGEDVASIDLISGQSCTIEVVSSGGLAYIRKLDPVNFSLSALELLEIKPEAGAGASVTPVGGTEYELRAGTGMAVGVHFVFGYTATATGLKEVELKSLLGGDPIDSLVINVTSPPIGTAFTYQGDLSDDGSTADGEYDFEFKLYNSHTTGDQIGLTVNQEEVSVSQGHFTVKLDFGDDPNVFNGDARWLEIGVRPGNAISGFIPLNPRQELTPSPYAIYAGSDNDWMISGNDMYSAVSGNVGIGTTAPYYRLVVNDDSNSDDELMVRSGTGGSIEGSAAILFQAANSGGTNEAAGKIELIPSTAAGNEKGGDLLFYTRNDAGTIGEKVRITNDGKVGIGTVSPGAKLDVVEDQSRRALNVTNTSAGTVLQTAYIYRAQNPSAENDILSVDVTSSAPDDFQFFECERGTDVKMRVWGNGSITADGTITGGGADFAEMIAVSSGNSSVEAGDVMVIDPDNPGTIVRSTQARSTLVAGVYSTKPGFAASAHDWDQIALEQVVAGGGAVAKDSEGSAYSMEELAADLNEIPLAVVGIVPCKVSSENGSIRPGDLLVTSSTPGHAMRDDNPTVGSVLGKALEILSGGTGVIKILVTLQ